MSRIFLVALSLLLMSTLALPAHAAPSSSIRFPSGQTSADNVLVLAGTAQVEIRFQNSAGTTDLNDVASTIQYVRVAAVNLNPSRVQISLDASWAIYDPTFTISRTSGTVTAALDTSAIYSPYSTVSTVYEYIWSLGPPSDSLAGYTDASQFTNGLKILRPGEWLQLVITEECQNVVGDSLIWFFFRATEAEYASGSYPTDITSIDSAHRANLYYSKLPGPSTTKYWLPLHNSYDPYDPNINIGHVFDQNSWTRSPTARAFSKANKLVHQKPPEDPEDPDDPEFSFHICGIKFGDTDRDGVYDFETELGIDGVTVTLLGPDKTKKAEEAYPEISYPVPEANPLQTGENLLLGSYCFNIVGMIPGKSYTFYVRIEEPEGRVATTSTLIGPIILVASADGPRESLDNHFGNMISLAVGGVVLPANKSALIAPLVVFLASIGIVAVSLAINKKSR
ncbi:MAG: hypothetical protein QXO25_03815 [Candidatus Bathyarchaeia archaeon]